VSFYSLLAVFPATASMVAIYGLFADPAAISSHLDSVSGLLPGGAIEVISGSAEDGLRNREKS
jgi:membrane protein